MKKSKQAYYDKYFERNWNNIRSTWKGIKSLISLKTVMSSVSTVLSLDNGDTITNPYDIANTFDNYFASIAETTKESMKYSHKHFSDYPSNESSSIIFLQPTDKEEIANIILSLNSNKASGPNSILYRILFLLKNETLKQLADLFNLSFMTGVFLSVLKTAKLLPVFKRDSVATIVQSPCFQMLKKYLKDLCIRDCIPSLITIILYKTYSLDSDNNILHLMP